MNIVQAIKKISILTIVYVTSWPFLSNAVKAQQSCVVTNANDIVCGRLLPNKGSSRLQEQKPLPQPVIRQEIKFELKSCQRKGGRDVDCFIKLTNLSNEVANLYTIPFHIKAISSEGIHYEAQNRKKGDFWIGSPDYGVTYKNLVSKKALLIKVSYVIPESAKVLDSIEVKVTYAGAQMEPVQLENVFIE
jgi:hypothetical protein